MGATEKKKTETTIEKNELEDKVFNLENQLKQVKQRYQTINEQVDETIAEN